MLGMGETLPPLKLWLGCLSSFRNIVSHGLSLVPHVCVCDLLCCRTHTFNSCYSDLIAWLCEGLCDAWWARPAQSPFSKARGLAQGAGRSGRPPLERGRLSGSWVLSRQPHDSCRRLQALWEALRRDERVTQAGQETFPRLHSS